ncbi:MAG: DNA repair protein RecN [Bacteroidota bacterium]
MLTRLYIKNFAIIQELEVQFQGGLVIITGETGAGKSILMGALGLALGERADASMMKDKQSKSIVEAEFKVKAQKELRDYFTAQEMDWDETIVIRREIHPAGKSRAFINDTPSGLAQIQQLTSLLVDLHQQFDTLELSNKHFQRLILDARAGCLDELSSYQEKFQQLKKIESTISSIQENMRKAEQERAFKEFLLQELDELNWKENEEKTIAEELNLLTNAEQIKQAVGGASYLLDEGEKPLVSEIKSLISKLQPLTKYHASLEEIVARLSTAHVELKDIANELSSLSDKITTDDKRLEELNLRMSTAQRLVKKHGLMLADELTTVHHGLQESLAAFQENQSNLEQLQQEHAVLKGTALEIAKLLQQKRAKQIPLLEKATKELLSRVGMPNALLKVDISETDLSPQGIDQIEFLFDANKSGKYEALHKVASGGELSRLMLVLKSLDMPTLIFDEIDSGISGEAAKQVGILLDELSGQHQLISITHQPQIAAKADQHLFVFKTEANNVISTGIKALSLEERVQAIAQMLSGENPSEHAIANAKEMIKN